MSKKTRKDEVAPACVRVLRTETLRRPDGRSWRVRRGDVYRGAQAARLWAQHRELVEPFPPPARE